MMAEFSQRRLDSFIADWQTPGRQLETGVKLFAFLDGEKHLLQGALDQAGRSGESLTLLLCTCKSIADWPFELLAQGQVFLLPQRLHLVRCVSEWGADTRVPPQDRPLKLLFMACSALNVKPELDFEREEEAIFHVTEKLPVDMEVEDSGSLEGLREQLLPDRFDVVHLSGHADIDKQGRPFFVMEDETGYRRDVTPRELWEEALMENPPQLLFLSGCRTGEIPGTGDSTGAAGTAGTAGLPGVPGTDMDTDTNTDTENEAVGAFAQELVERYHVPAVLGWGRSVGDGQATLAEEMLYRELSRGRSIPEAVQRARFELLTAFAGDPNPDWWLLRLFGSGGGGTLDAMVAAGQIAKPKPRRMSHIYLEQSLVKVLREGFVGRRRQLQQCLRALKQDRDKIGVLLLGTAGLGKSCLAGKLCERFKTHTPVIIHGRLDAVSLHAALEKAFMVSGDKKGKEILAEKLEMTKKLAELCASGFKERNYLLLLDDFEQNLEGAAQGEPGALLPEARALVEVLLEYLPFSGKETLLIVTSRYGFSLVDGQGRDSVAARMERVYLTMFQEAEQRKKAQELPNIYDYQDPSVAEQLLAAGLGNPRLMEWVNTLVGQMNRVEVSRLLEAVRDKKEEFIRCYVIRELLDRGGERMAVFMRWFGIYRIPVGREGARLVAEKAGLAEWAELLGRGMELSLVEHFQARQVYSVTPLLREELVAGLAEDQVKDGHAAAFAYYQAVCVPRGKDMDPLPVEEWIYHALACGEEEEATHQGSRLVNYLRERLAFLESQRVGEWVLLEKKRKQPALSTEDDAFILNETALTTQDLGDYRKAIEYYEQALTIYKKVQGEEHPNVAAVLNNVGEGWRNLGDPQKSIDYYQQALIILKKVHGEEHQDVATTLNNLGAAYYSLGDHRKAIEYLEQALIIHRAVLGEQHPDVARDLNNLGAAFYALGDHGKAIEYYQQALTINRAVLGEQHPDVAIDLNNLGEALRNLGDPQKAIDYYRQALIIWKNVYGEKHPHVAIGMNNIGEACRESGDPQKAIGYYRQALTISKNVYGENHPQVATGLNNLGLAWKSLGDPKKAIEYYQQALIIDRAVLGEQHPKVARDLNNLGAAFYALGDHGKAIEFFEQALTIDRAVFGEQHPEVAIRLNNLGIAYFSLGQRETAKGYFEKAHAIWKKVFGDDHPHTKIAAKGLEICSRG